MSIQHFRTKLLICLLCCTLLPLFIIGIISYTTSYRIAHDKMIESARLYGRQNSEIIKNRMLQVESVADSIQFSMYSLNTIPEIPLSKYLDEYSIIKNQVNSLNSTFNLYHITLFVDPSLIISNEGITVLSLEKLSDYGITPNVASSLGASAHWMFRKNQSYPYAVSHNRQENVLLCFRSTSKIVNGNKVPDYAFCIAINTNEFSNLLHKTFEGTPISSYLINQNGTVISHSDSSLNGTQLSNKHLSQIQAETLAEYNDEHLLLTKISTDLTLITSVPDTYIRSNIFTIIQILVIVVILTIVTTLVATFYISTQLTKKLQNLTSIMTEMPLFDGKVDTHDLEVLIIHSNRKYDEIDQLAITLYNMILAMDTNFQKILNLSLKEEKLKYQLLQSQINPHFLYNILGTIQTCQSLGQFDESNKMLLNLSQFYRHILHNPDEMVTIREELAISLLYLEMESICKKGSFSYNIEMEEDIDTFMICKFTLQPILENSLLHGIREHQMPLHININISYQEDTILILIKDNGSGMSSQKLTSIQAMLKSGTVNYHKHFGLGNINKRLSTWENGFGHLWIESIPNLGTTVVIEIAQLLPNNDTDLTKGVS